MCCKSSVQTKQTAHLNLRKIKFACVYIEKCCVREKRTNFNITILTFGSKEMFRKRVVPFQRLPEDHQECFNLMFMILSPHNSKEFTKPFFHRSCYNFKLNVQHSVSVAVSVTGIISSFSPICFSVQQFFFAISFVYSISFVASLTNVLATLCGSVFFCR